MVKKLRYKFILIASISILLVIFFISGLIIGTTYISTCIQAKQMADYIAENGGSFPKFNEKKDNNGYMNEETQYTTRYFTVLFDDNGNVTMVNDDNVVAIDENEATELATSIINKNSSYGVAKYTQYKYFYSVNTDSDSNEIMVVFVDCTSDFIGDFLMVRMCAIIGGLCFILCVSLISIFSKRAIEPSIRNIENQKAFITNAGHELKTPLAVISANNEVLEMMNGKNEWTEAISTQVKRMTALVTDFIALARMNEREDLVMSEVNVTDIAVEVTDSFKSVISQQKKEYAVSIADKVKVQGDERVLHELLNILVDNAAKYCDEAGKVTVKVDHRSKETGAIIQVSNTYEEGKNVDYTRFFDRFYREDKSHNSKKKGFGIGLSMAESIVEMHKGKLKVNYNNTEKEITFTVILY